MTRKTLIALACTLAAPVLAQTTDQPAFGDKGRDGSYLQAVDGTDIRNTNGDKIGEVEEVLIDADGLPAGFLVEIGGFLGIGERDVAIPLNALEWNGSHYVSTMTRQQLEQLDEFDD